VICTSDLVYLQTENEVCEFEALVLVHCCRILSQEFPSDITIQVGEATFNLHKVNLNHSASVSVLGYWPGILL